MLEEAAAEEMMTWRKSETLLVQFVLSVALIYHIYTPLIPSFLLITQSIII